MCVDVPHQNTHIHEESTKLTKPCIYTHGKYSGARTYAYIYEWRAFACAHAYARTTCEPWKEETSNPRVDTCTRTQRETQCKTPRQRCNIGVSPHLDSIVDDNARVACCRHAEQRAPTYNSGFLSYSHDRCLTPKYLTLSGTLGQSNVLSHFGQQNLRSTDCMVREGQTRCIVPARMHARTMHNSGSAHNTNTPTRRETRTWVPLSFA